MSDSTVLVFPSPRQSAGQAWRLGGRCWSARVQHDGSFVVPTVLPNRDLLAVAISGTLPELWMAPDVVERLEALAVRFRLEAGQRRVIELRAVAMRW